MTSTRRKFSEAGWTPEFVLKYGIMELWDGPPLIAGKLAYPIEIEGHKKAFTFNHSWTNDELFEFVRALSMAHGWTLTRTKNKQTK